MWRMLFFGMALAIVFGNPTLGPDGVLHAKFSNSLYAVNSDGSTKWIFDANASLVSHAEGLSSTVYATTVEGTLFSLDSFDGSIKWKHQLDGNRKVANEYHPPVVGADGTIYLTSRPFSWLYCNDKIDAIDTTGAVKWTFFIAHCGSLSAVGADGTLFVKSRKSLDALQPNTGTVKWSVAFDDNDYVFVAFAEDHVFLLRDGDNPGVLSSLSNEDGSILWNHSVSLQPIVEWMTLGSKNEVYVNGVTLRDGTCSLRVFDFNGSALRDLPCFNLPWPSLSSKTSHHGDEEDVFVTVLGEGNVLAHSGTDGRLLWNVSVPEDVGPDYLWDSGAHFGQDGTVFVWSYSEDSDAHAYAIRNGKVAWSVQTGGASQQLMLEDGTTYVQGWVSHPPRWSKDGLEIVAVGADGVEKWRYTPTEAAAKLV